MSFLSNALKKRGTTDYYLLRLLENTISESKDQKVFNAKELTPLLTVNKVPNPQIPILAIGGGGMNLGASLANRFGEYSVNYSIAAIDTDKENIDNRASLFTDTICIGDGLGTAKQFRKGSAIAIDHKDQLRDFIDKYLKEFHMRTPHEIVFLLLGAGGTGVGVGLQVVKILKEMGKRPVPFLILPFTNESTRVKFTSAAALYHFSYAPGERSEKLITVIIDNDAFYQQNMKLSEELLINGINQRVGAVLADILISTEIESTGYSTDLNEFLEVFRTVKGLGMFSYIHSKEYEDPIVSYFERNNPNCNSLIADPLSSTRSYTFLQSETGSISALDFRDFFTKFENSDVFPKLATSNSHHALDIRGLYVGIRLPDRIRKMMIEAEDARVRVIGRQLEAGKEGNLNPKMDLLKDGEEIEVETAEEIRGKLAEEAAALRRGDDSTE